MARAEYRNRGATVEIGDFVRGWEDADGTKECAGVVLSVHPDNVHGSNVVLGVIEYDEYPQGDEPTPEDAGPDALLFKNHEGNAVVARLATVEAHSERFELVFRRSNLEGHRGVLREADPEARAGREARQRSRARQMEAQQFVPPRGATPAPAPVSSAPPPALPKKPAAPEGKDAAKVDAPKQPEKK